MWHSEADILKDLASVNDFNDPEKSDSFKVLYSFGRGTQTKQKPKLLNTFIDPRTGEAIHVDNVDLEVNDMCCKTKGRGSVLGYFSKSKSQLQKQLRLARPLGSSDGAVESFFNRNMPAKNQENSISSSDSKPDSQKMTEISAGPSNSPFNSLRARQRVKAIRNSKLQHNVLIGNLLSKVKTTSGSDFTTEKQNFDHDNNDDDTELTNTSSCRSLVDDTSCNNNPTEFDFEKYDSDRR